MLYLVRRRLAAARFALWRRVVTARLGRLGVEVRWELAGTPHCWTLPRLEPVIGPPGPGRLTIRLGRDVKLGRELILEVWTGTENLLEIDDRSTFEAFCRVQLQGGTIRLAHDVHVRDLALLKTKSVLEVGEWTVLSRGVHLHATAGVHIGAHGAIGERSSLIDSDHTVGGSEPVLRRPLKAEPIVLGRNVAVSANCVLLRGTRVGENAVIAAGAVLNGGEYPAGWLVAGLPAHALRALESGNGEAAEASH
ncbi:MAG: acyltransferase [Solirubrobacterales bacterium]|nr:acyltransferase [Solirubrobacterales bacterium]